MDKGRISADELSQKLVNARKVMKKVDGGNFEKGAINEKVLRSDPEALMTENAPTVKSTTKPVAVPDASRINQSKLPDNIKKAMLENPIPQIGLNDSLDMNFVEKTRQLMQEDGQYVTPSTAPSTAPSSQPVKSPTTMKLSSSDLTRTLTPIIENIIRKTLDEIVDRKLTQLLAAQVGNTLNENLAIKVGDTIFTGKITKSKSAK